MEYFLRSCGMSATSANQAAGFDGPLPSARKLNAEAHRGKCQELSGSDFAQFPQFLHGIMSAVRAGALLGLSSSDMSARRELQSSLTVFGAQ